MDRELKNLFEKIGLEQAPEGFTLRVMNNIGHGFVKTPVKKSVWGSYRFLAGYIIAVVIITPLIVPAVRYLSYLRIRRIDFDLSFITGWFNSIAEIFTSGSLSIGLAIIAAGLILFFSLASGRLIIRLFLPQGTYPAMKTGS